MDYKLNSNANDDVEFIKPAGVMFVKSSMPSGKAKAVIATGTVEKSDKFDGFEIMVNGGEYYFAGTITADKPSKAEKPADEVKAEPKKTAGKGKAKAKSE